MRADLALSTSTDVANLRHAVVSRLGVATAVAQLQEIWAICSRAQAAAHHYTTHKCLSDQALAARGLTRADLPGAALAKLNDCGADKS